MRTPILAKKQVIDVLAMVCSVSEAAKMFCVHENTVKYHIKNGSINARLVGRDYVIEIESLRGIYGKEISSLEY